MHFDESYFIGEEREGFFVEETMKRAWAAQLEVIKEIERICKKYNLNYYAGYGTLLGAVRHKGFIPWDDDMDIFMLRDDYAAFLSVVQKEMPEGYALHNVYTVDDYDEIFSRLVNSQKIDFSDEFMERYHGFPYVVGIDIFPLDFLSRDKEEDQLQYDVYKFVLGVKGHVVSGEDDVEELIGQVEELCQVKLDRDMPLKKQLIILLDRLSSLYHREESDEVAITHSRVQGFSQVMKKEWFEDVIWMPFENTQLPVPKNYDGCLIAIFGEDYMTPVRFEGHEYPFYRKQERILQAAIEAKQKEQEMP